MNHDRDIDTQDIDWMAGQQPQRIGSDPFVTSDPFARERALQALVRHMDQSPGRRFGLRRLFGLRALGLAAAVGAAALVAVAVLSSGGGHADTAAGTSGSTALIGSGGGHEAAGPLMQLASYVSKSPEPPGNATLVQRTTTYGGKSETSYDLYGDEGQYVWSPTKEGIIAVKEGRTDAVPGAEAGDGGITARELAAAEEANTGDVVKAAEDMAKATGNPHEQHFRPGDDLYPNRVWEWSQQAIIAGAGKPDIRAGVLKMLDTLPGMKITESVEANIPTLVLTSGPAESGAGYQEELTINADTGVPIKFVGGPSDGGPAATTVEYQVSRGDYAGLPAAPDLAE